jgi:hypothetical protein
MPRTTRIDVQARQLVVRTWPEHRERCKAVPGYRYDPSPPRWLFPATPAYAMQLAEAFEGVDVVWSEAAMALKAQDEPMITRPVVTAADEQAVQEHWQFKTPPWAHQVSGVAFVQQIFGRPPRRDR